MPSSFRIAAALKPEQMDWGTFQWVSSPQATGARQLTAFHATLFPGKGHSFHKHPNQEEVLSVVSGKIEQWLGEEKRLLGPGDSVFISPGLVHATFNAGNDDASLVVIFGPCVGEGFEAIDVSGEAPWKDIRK